MTRRAPRDLLLFAEAALLIVLAAIGLRAVSFRAIGGIASRRARCQRVEDRRTTINRVRWAVDAAARRSPLRALCFERGLTAQYMLRRRGIDSLLHFGVAPGAHKPLEAHVWVTADGVDVVGGETSAAFAPLIAFPDDRHGSEQP